MFKKTGLLVLGLALLVSVLFILEAQSEEKGWKKTVTLPSGEVVCDLNGEWELILMPRGELVQMIGGNLIVPIKISQEGNFFKGIRIRGNQFRAAGTVAIEGELDKNGLKKILFESGRDLGGQVEHTAKLSKDGNLIEFNDRNNNFFVEITRK